MFEKEAKERAKRLEEKQTLGVYEDDTEARYDEGWNKGEVSGYQDGFQDGANFGYQEGLKAKINATTISDCPVKDKWHDLRKDPNDLPTCDCETVTLHENGNKNIQKWKNGNWTNAIIIPVIAWYELLKFEEE